MTALVRFEHVGKQYTGGDKPALSDVNLEVGEGDRIALVGRSGSGKSTLLNLIAALDVPTAGQITWPGLDSPPATGDVGTAFQSASLIPWLTVEENVRLPLLLSARKRSADPVGLLERLGVANLVNKLPSELSGGQAQRVGLARAMVSTPALLVADEPSGQLDHHTAEQVIATLKNWADANGSALVIATHDPAIAGLMTRQWTLDHGQMTEIPQ